MSAIEDNRVRVGNYVIVQKQNYRKLSRVTENGTVTLGKELIEIKGIIDKPYWTTFQMIQSRTNKKIFTLEVAARAETSEELRKALTSGHDNRTIWDDGKSQKLSKEEIEDLRESGKSSNEIVGRLIENSKSFTAKTEYSQDKYIKKKERKYFRYVTIRRPTIDILQEIYFRQDYTRISCLRMDALSQILSYSDVKSDGIYMIYDSGSMGLPASAMLNRIGADTEARIVHLHPGNQPQTTLVQAMNFPIEQSERLLAVNLYSFLRYNYQGESTIMEEIASKTSVNAKNGNREEKKIADASKSVDGNSEETRATRNNSEEENINPAKKRKRDYGTADRDSESLDNAGEKIKSEEANNSAMGKNMDTSENIAEGNDAEIKNVQNSDNSMRIEEAETTLRDTRENFDSLKRKQSDEEGESLATKKPRWLLETGKAVELCKKRRVEGLVVVAKEHPLNIVKALLTFLGTSRPFVIYHCYREPLQETYVALKQRRDIVNLRLFSNFLRSYQVLPNRTHPDIMTNDLGGYLLTGYLVD